MPLKSSAEIPPFPRMSQCCIPARHHARVQTNAQGKASSKLNKKILGFARTDPHVLELLADVSQQDLCKVARIHVRRVRRLDRPIRPPLNNTHAAVS